MQHVAGIRYRPQAAIADVRHAALDHCGPAGPPPTSRMLGEPLRYIRLRADDKERRCGDVAPYRVGFLDSINRRKWQTVPRIRCESHAAVGCGLGPMAREKLGLVARQPTIALLQAIGYRGEARVRRETLLFGERIEPPRALRWRLIRTLDGHAEAVERTGTANASRPHARVVEHDVAAKAVAHDVNRLVRGELVEQRFEIGEVIGEPVALRLPRALPVTAQIGRDHVPRLRERID